MIISDLAYLEVAAESASVQGGLLDLVGGDKFNNAPIKQLAFANAGGSGINLLPVAASVNAALPIQALA